MNGEEMDLEIIGGMIKIKIQCENIQRTNN